MVVPCQTAEAKTGQESKASRDLNGLLHLILERPSLSSHCVYLTYLRNVLCRVDLGGDSLDLSTQFLFDLIEVEAILICDEVDGNSQVSESSGTPNSVEISLRVLREIEVDDNVHGLNVDTSGKQIRANQIPATPVAEIVEDTVTMGLQHLGVDVETGIP